MPGYNLDYEDKDVVDDSMKTLYEAVVVRANHLAQYRPDIQFAVTELCRQMVSPKIGDFERLRRFARYLLGKPRFIMKYDFQLETDCLSVLSDSSWAGCKTTRKSTSGGLIMVGTHFVNSYAKTQASIALSSGEAEVIAMLRAGSEAVGLMNVAVDLGINVTWARMYVDAAAAIGIAQREDLDKSPPH